MQTLEHEISRADGVFERVQREERLSEVIDLDDVIEEEPYRSLRSELRDIDELAAKIRERGQLVPILVWLRRGSYVLLSGHRRTAALRKLGESTVQAIVYGDRDLSERDALDIAIDDNVDRDSFSKLEMATLVNRLIQEGMTQRKVARRLRLSNGTVSDYYRLCSAPPDIQEAVDRGRLAMRAGLRLQKEEAPVRERVLARAEAGMLSLGDVERLLAGDAPKTGRRRARRGGAWSREKGLVSGLAWERQREGEREIRVRLPAEPTEEQRVALRRLLLDQVRSL